MLALCTHSEHGGTTEAAMMLVRISLEGDKPGGGGFDYSPDRMARAAEMEIITEPARRGTTPTAGGLGSCHGNQGLPGHSSLGLAPFPQPNICFLKGCWELVGVAAKGEWASISLLEGGGEEKNPKEKQIRTSIQ